jgi:hypothetical protein
MDVDPLDKVQSRVINKTLGVGLKVGEAGTFGWKRCKLESCIWGDNTHFLFGKFTVSTDDRNFMKDD